MFHNELVGKTERISSGEKERASPSEQRSASVGELTRSSEASFVSTLSTLQESAKSVTDWSAKEV